MADVHEMPSLLRMALFFLRQQVYQGWGGVCDGNVPVASSLMLESAAPETKINFTIDGELHNASKIVVRTLPPMLTIFTPTAADPSVR